MGHSGDRRTLPQRQRPFAVDGRIDIGRKPIDSRKPRITLSHFLQPRVRHDPDRASAERHDVMVEALERKSVEVCEVARDVKLCNLAVPARHFLGARHPALKEDKARIKVLARPDHDLVRADLAGFRDHAADRFFFFGTNLGAATQLLKMYAYHEWLFATLFVQ